MRCRLRGVYGGQKQILASLTSWAFAWADLAEVPNGTSRWGQFKVLGDQGGYYIAVCRGTRKGGGTNLGMLIMRILIPEATQKHRLKYL